MTPAILTAALLLALGAGAAPAKPSEPGSQPPVASPSAKDPAALTLLKRMCDRLQAAKTFTVRGQASVELPVADGTLATFFNEYDTAVRRPDGLAAHRVGDLPDFRFVYDGKAMTVFVSGTGRWGTTAAPPTLDAMLPVAGEEGGLNMPFDELLVADPCAAIMAGAREAVVTKPATIRGKKVEHLVLSGPQLRIEYWIESGHRAAGALARGLRRRPTAAALPGGVRRVEARPEAPRLHLRPAEAKGRHPGRLPRSRERVPVRGPSMRVRNLVIAGLLASLAIPGTGQAVVVVRRRPAPVVAAVAVTATVVVVAAAASKPPPTPPPPPSAPPPPPVTSPLPIDSTTWVLPSGCLGVTVKGETLYQCGPSWLKKQQSDKGTWYLVVPPP